MMSQLWRILLLVALAIASGVFEYPAYADYVLATQPGGIARYSNSGEKIVDFVIPNFDFSGYTEFVGESVEGMTLGADGQVYAVVNDLGQGTIFRFNPLTGIGEEFGPGFASVSPYTIPGAIKFGPHGDLYGISVAWDGTPDLDPENRVLRFDSESGDVVKVLNGAEVPTSESGFFWDLESRPGANPTFDGELLVAIRNGLVQRHSQIRANPLSMLSQPFTVFDTGVDELLGVVIGPDGLLYVRDAVTDNVIRYDVDLGTVVDTFIDAPEAIGNGDLFFGPGGDLILVNAGPRNVGHLARFDGVSGAFLDTIIPELPEDYFGDEPDLRTIGLYLPIPEPMTLSSAILLLAGGSMSRFFSRKCSVR